MTYRAIAERLLGVLAPYCERVEIGGNVRRGKPDPKDIEIVAVPKTRSVTRRKAAQGGMFEEDPLETVEVDELDAYFTAMRDAGEVTNRGAWGPRHKRLVFEGAPIDLFCVLPPASWGVLFALRTGPAEFGKLMVTSRSFGGAMPADRRVKGGALWHGGELVETPEEADYFREVGVPCWPPPERTEQRLRAWLRGDNGYDVVKYRTIVADPPWPYEAHPRGPSSFGRLSRHELPYPQMTLVDVAALPVSDLAEKDAHLWLWTTNRYLPQSFAIVEGWGFKYRQTFIWRKTGCPSPFAASVAPNHAEYLIFARRGVLPLSSRLASNVVNAPQQRAHSQKPDVFIDLIEQVSPGPYLELFARRVRLGWDGWGNEWYENAAVLL